MGPLLPGARWFLGGLGGRDYQAGLPNVEARQLMRSAALRGAIAAIAAWVAFLAARSVLNDVAEEVRGGLL